MQSIDSRLWAIEPSTMARMQAEALRFAEGRPVKASGEAAAAQSVGARRGSVAVLKLSGLLTPRADDVYSMIFGGTSTIEFGQVLDALAADESVKAALVEVDSPGGTVSGTPELFARVRAFAAQKPIVFSARHFMASAAVWIAAGGSEIVAEPSADIGSIGVRSEHVDASAMYEKWGLKVTVKAVPEAKAEFDSAQPLGDEAMAELTRGVEYWYDRFVADVAKGRDVTEAKVKRDFGGGRLLEADRALSAGLIDRVETFDATVRRLVGSGAGKGLRRAAMARRVEARKILRA